MRGSVKMAARKYDISEVLQRSEYTHRLETGILIIRTLRFLTDLHVDM